MSAAPGPCFLGPWSRFFIISCPTATPMVRIIPAMMVSQGLRVR